MTPRFPSQPASLSASPGQRASERPPAAPRPSAPRAPGRAAPLEGAGALGPAPRRGRTGAGARRGRPFLCSPWRLCCGGRAWAYPWSRRVHCQFITGPAAARLQARKSRLPPPPPHSLGGQACHPQPTQARGHPRARARCAARPPARLRPFFRGVPAASTATCRAPPGALLRWPVRSGPVHRPSTLARRGPPHPGARRCAAACARGRGRAHTQRAPTLVLAVGSSCWPPAPEAGK
jgi:hypothetical protein